MSGKEAHGFTWSAAAMKCAARKVYKDAEQRNFRQSTAYRKAAR